MRLSTMAALIGSALTLATPLMAQEQDNGLIRVTSPHSVAETADRFEAAAAERGIRIFDRFDHALAASEYGLELSPLVTINFGNPRYGTPFMANNPQAGIDFPPKALVYEDDEGQVWLAYNSAEYLYNTIFVRHGLEFPEDHIAFQAGVLQALSDAAVAE